MCGNVASNKDICLKRQRRGKLVAKLRQIVIDMVASNVRQGCVTLRGTSKDDTSACIYLDRTVQTTVN